MKKRDFSIERLNTTVRYNKINADLENTIQAIKELNLENVGASISVITRYNSSNRLGIYFRTIEI